MSKKGVQSYQVLTKEELLKQATPQYEPEVMAERLKKKFWSYPEGGAEQTMIWPFYDSFIDNRMYIRQLKWAVKEERLRTTMLRQDVAKLRRFIDANDLEYLTGKMIAMDKDRADLIKRVFQPQKMNKRLLDQIQQERAERLNSKV